MEINHCVGCNRQFFTKSFLGDDAAVLAPSRGGRRDDSARTRRKILISTQVNILEDALKDAQKKTMLEDYSVDPAALRR